MKFRSTILLDRFFFSTPESSVLSGVISDLEQQGDRTKIYKMFEECDKDIGSEGSIGEAYSVKELDKEYIGFYLSAAFINESYDEAPEDQRLKVKTAFFLKIVKKWMEEEKEYKKDPEAYKNLIEKGVKVFEIEED